MKMYTFTLWSESCGDPIRPLTFDTEEEAMDYAHLWTRGSIRWEDNTKMGWTHGICSECYLDWYIEAKILRD